LQIASKISLFFFNFILQNCKNTAKEEEKRREEKGKRKKEKGKKRNRD